jgi:hypothetical protein
MAVRVTQLRVQVATDSGPAQVRVSQVRVAVARSLAAFSGSTSGSFSITTTADAIVQMGGQPAVSSFLFATDASAEVRASTFAWASASSSIVISPSGDPALVAQATLAWFPADAVDDPTYDGTYTQLTSMGGVSLVQLRSSALGAPPISWSAPISCVNPGTTLVVTIHYVTLMAFSSIAATVSLGVSQDGGSPVPSGGPTTAISFTGGTVGAVSSVTAVMTYSGVLPGKLFGVKIADPRTTVTEDDRVGIIGVEIRNRI